jgi:hypothetical protein
VTWLTVSAERWFFMRFFPAKLGLLEESATGRVYPAATLKRGFAQLAAGTNKVLFGGRCRGRTYGPLIKSGRRPMIGTARCCEGFPVYR